MGCKECGKPKCNGECGCKSPKVLQINNPAEYITFHKVSIPAAMGDSITNPPKIGAYRNALVYYEADHTSWMYSTGGIPTKLTNGLTDYNEAVNLPQINGHTLIGNQSSSDLGLQGELTAGANIQIDGNVISATDTTYTAGNGIELDGTEIKAKIGDGLEFGNNGEINIADIEQYAHFFDNVADMKASENLIAGSYARTTGYYSANDGGGALYKIRAITNDDVVDEMFIIEMGDGSDQLVAELITNGVYKPEQLGAKNDGSTDASSIFEAIFEHMNDNEKVELTGTYLVGSPLYLPNKNNVVISGGTLKATNSFNGYIFNSNTTASTGYAGWAFKTENLTLENVFIDGSYSADGIYLTSFVRAKIINCTIHNIKNYGIYLTGDSHEAQIINTNIIGRTNGYDDSNVISTGIYVNNPDNIFNNCVIAYCQWAIDFHSKFNQIENCHFYCNRNGGGNIKTSGASFLNFTNNYFDGCGLYAIDPWNITLSDNLFLLSDNTSHLIDFHKSGSTANIKGMFITNSRVDDVRTDKTVDIEFITCDFTPTEVDNNHIDNIRLPNHVNLSNPANIFILDDSISPVIIPDSFFAATNTSNTIGTHNTTDNKYTYVFNSNHIETEWIGSSGYPWLFFKVYLPTKCRVNCLKTTNNAIAIFAEDETYIGNNMATLSAGYYYVGIYRTDKVTLSNQ